MTAHRTPRQLLRQALNWVEETGWLTYQEDTAIADRIFRAWIAHTDVEFVRTHQRDREMLSDALYSTFRAIRDDRAADCLYALFMVLLEIRGRREGILQRNRNH